MKRLLPLTILCAVAAWTPARADLYPPPGPPSEQKLALTRRYLAAIQVDERTEQMLSAMTPRLIQVMREHRPDITDQQAKALTEASMKVTSHMVSRSLELSIPIYASLLNEKELQALVDFYESPVGRSITAKSPRIAEEASKVALQLLPDMQKEMAALCDKVKCGKPSN